MNRPPAQAAAQQHKHLFLWYGRGIGLTAGVQQSQLTELLNTHQTVQRLWRDSRAEQSDQEHPLMGWVGAPLHSQSHSKEMALESTNPCFVTPLQIKLSISRVWHSW